MRLILEKIEKSYFMSQPHQPFFAAGVIHAIISILIFWSSHQGIILLTIPENSFHIYTLAYIVFTSFFFGFVFTTFPRFCNSVSIPKETYRRIFLILQLGAILFFIGALFSLSLLLLGSFLLLFANATGIFALYWIFKIGQSTVKNDPFWILIAFAIGLMSHVLFTIDFSMYLFSKSFYFTSYLSSITFNMYLIFLTFVVAQRMVPFFSHSQVQKPEYFIAIVFSLFALKTLTHIFSINMLESATTIILGIAIMHEVLKWKFQPFKSAAILWILHLAFFWLPLGYMIGGITSAIEIFGGYDFVYLETHLLALGFLTTILIGFGSRVTLGHSGQTPHADKVTLVLFAITQLLVCLRFFFSIGSGMGEPSSILFNLVVITWIFLYLSWILRYGKTIFFGK